jgi:hypothetical protein
MATRVAPGEQHSTSPQACTTPQVFVDMRKTCACTSTTVYVTFDPNSIVTAAPDFITYPTELRREIRPHALRTPIAYVPQRFERARERGAGRRARAPSSDDPDPESDQPPVEVWRGLAAASARMVQHCERRRAKWAAA